MPLWKKKRNNQHATANPVKTESVNNDEIVKLLKAVQTEENGNLQKFIITQDIFKKIRENLVATIESMEKNPSLLSRAARFWGGFPLWGKILAGIILTVPLLILGIVAHLGFVLAICGVTAVFYTGISLLLDNHHKCAVRATENFSKGIMGLANLLELTITALDRIRQKLAEEVQKFATENEKLAKNVSSLGTQIEQLSIEVETSAKLACSLKETKKELEETVKKLEGQAVKQEEILNSHKKELAQLTDEYSKCQAKMTADVEDFGKIKNQLQKEVTAAKQLADYFATLSREMSIKLFEDEKIKQKFNERLTTFLNDGKASFAALAERWGEAEEKFKQSQAALAQSNEMHRALLETQKTYTDKLEAITFKIAGAYSPKVRNALNQVGFFTRSNPTTPEEKKVLDCALNSFLGELPVLELNLNGMEPTIFTSAC
jgi:hypothetical protein